MSESPLNATLIARHDLNDNVSVVRVRPDSGRVADFTPGQFVTVGLPRGAPGQLAAVRPVRAGRVPLVKRAYSIASSPGEADSYELLVVLVAGGKLTPKLWTLNVGDRLWVDEEAKGEFTLDGVPEGRDLVMVSTGTGIAPFMSMLRTYRGQGRWRRFVVIHGVRAPFDLAYRDELERTASEDATVKYVPLVSRATEATAWDGLRGRVGVALDPPTYRHLVGAPLEPATCHVFLCGNPAMIDDVERFLLGLGFRSHTRERPGNLHLERYW